MRVGVFYHMVIVMKNNEIVRTETKRTQSMERKRRRNQIYILRFKLIRNDPKEKSVPSKFPQASLDVQVFIDHCLKSQPYSVESTLYLINPNLLLIFGNVQTGKMSVHDQL